MATIFATSLVLSGCDGGTYKIGVTANVEDQDTEQTTDEDNGNSGGSTDETEQSDDQSSDNTDSGDANDDESDNQGDSSGQEDDVSEQDGSEQNDTDGSNDENSDSGTENNQDSADDANEDNQSEDSSDQDSDSEQSGDTDSDNNCSAAAWNSTATYVGGDQVVHNGVLYQAKWWTQTEPPAQEWQQISEGCSVDENANQDNDNSGDNNNDNDINDDAIIVENPGDKVVASYFVEWGVYGRNFHVMDIPAEKLTHILYGFIPICGPNDSLQSANPSGYSALVSQCSGKPDYSVVVHDKYAALEKSYPGDKWDDPIKGNFGQMIKLKQQYPHLKIIPSVGGWTLSDPFYYFANDPQKRSVFVNSMIDFIQQYSFFDGIDIDWEYPGGNGANASLGSGDDFQGYADLMRDLRTALDELELETGREYELTSAIGAGPSKIDAVNYSEAHNYLDYIFAMTYDYYGAWDNTVGHHAALNDYSESVREGFYAKSGVSKLMSLGVPSNKIVVGAAMYGRGWSGVQVPYDDGSILDGIGSGPCNGTWEAGVLDYKAIVTDYLGGTNGTGINGYTYYYDEVAEAPYLYNSTNGTFITYDNPRSVMAKGSYVQQNNLGGLFSWEIDADNGDILDAMHEGLGNPLEVKNSE